MNKKKSRKRISEAGVSNEATPSKRRRSHNSKENLCDWKMFVFYVVSRLLGSTSNGFEFKKFKLLQIVEIIILTWHVQETMPGVTPF